MTPLAAGVVTEASLGLSHTGQADFPLVVTQTMTPEQVFILGSGMQPQAATIELSLRNPQKPLYPLDIVLVLDNSQIAHFPDIQALARGILKNLHPQDRLAIITTGGEAQLAVGFTNEFAALEELITDLLPQDGNRIASALKLAVEELRFHGRADATQIILLTGSGMDSGASTSTLLILAEEARRSNIRIFPIGTASFIDAKTLSRLALISRGRFYARFNTKTLIFLFHSLQREIVPPRDIVITQVLPTYIEYLGAEVNPPLVKRKGPGASTLLQWHIPSLPPGSSWQTRFAIGSTKAGRVPVLSHLWRSRVRLIDEYGPFGPIEREQILPMLRLNVRAVPTAYFSFRPRYPLVGEDVHFTDLSSDDGRIVTWEWYFGDGRTSREQHPTHRYEEPGRYVVLLVVTDEDGATDVALKELIVREPLPPPPPTREEICTEEILAILFETLGDLEAVEALKQAIAQQEPLGQKLAEIVDLLASVIGWDSETISKANQKVVEFLKAAFKLVPRPEIAMRVESLALMAVFEFIESWPELRASCQG